MRLFRLSANGSAKGGAWLVAWVTSLIRVVENLRVTGNAARQGCEKFSNVIVF